MTAAIQPYREAAEVVPVRKGPTAGLMIPTVAKMHQCHPPTAWARFWRRLVGHGVPFGALWRCSTCGVVWKAVRESEKYQGACRLAYPFNVYVDLYWREEPEDSWTKNGGAL